MAGIKPKVGSGLGLLDVCPPRDEAGWREAASGQTLNKPPGTKPRSAAARFEQDPAYGDSSSAAVPEMTDDRGGEPPAAHRSAPTSVVGGMFADARDCEF